jgi:microcystin-dependent protein
MSLLTRSYTFTDGDVAYGSQVESEVANIVNTLNSLDNAGTTWTNVKVTTLSPQDDVDMGGHKLENLGSPNTSGDAAVYPVTYAQLGSTATAFLVPTGALLMYGATSAPSGFLLCDGTAVSRTTYSTLFGIISTTYGVGDGSSTFNVPDMRAYFPLGYKSGTNTMAATGGSNTPSLTAASDGAHTHTLTVTSSQAGVNWSAATSVGSMTSAGALRNIAAGGGETVDYYSPTAASNGAHTHTITGQDTRPPYLVVNYIIKT